MLNDLLIALHLYAKNLDEDDLWALLCVAVRLYSKTRH